MFRTNAGLWSRALIEPSCEWMQAPVQIFRTNAGLGLLVVIEPSCLWKQTPVQMFWTKAGLWLVIEPRVDRKLVGTDPP